MYNANYFAQQTGEGRDVPVAPLPPIVGNPESGGYPVAPLPPFVENPESGNYPVIPLPPFVENPESGNYPVIPLPPFVGEPDLGPGYPVPPIAPEDQLPVYPGLQPPAFPGYGTVRFMHAAASLEPVRISIGLQVIASNLSYSSLTPYQRVMDGFYAVSITSARNPRTVLYQSRIPFNAGEIVTMAIVPSGNGVNLVRISDQPCNNRPRNRACIRAVNLVYNSPALDVILNDGRIAFSDVRYKEVTGFKQARSGTYDFYIAQTPYVVPIDLSGIDTLENIPSVITNFVLPGYGNVDPLVSFQVDVRQGVMYTIYMLGNWDNPMMLGVVVVENY